SGKHVADANLKVRYGLEARGGDSTVLGVELARWPQLDPLTDDGVAGLEGRDASTRERASDTFDEDAHRRTVGSQRDWVLEPDDAVKRRFIGRCRVRPLHGV